MGDDQSGYPNPWEPGYVDQSATPPLGPGEGVNTSSKAYAQFRMDGGYFVEATTPQPKTDPDEPWVELEPLTRISVLKMWDLLEALRSSGVAALAPKPKRSSLFSRNLVDVQLRVPQRMEQDARMIVARELGVR